ncbi:hypothetical protein BCR37DRAFT_377994 [Protomyces lactucae-debilis]|uniref:Uncharacterized protein n=1 Tax=Protomyces lactucae-debilis TaxID=2754530 RepID=A0A1Y2FN56_PROLT|nr:uncharacterized protein BCR37DRAFT_377994 [Protomyces lactucae-debilis]ORY85017.1 hypothetical protein BCR37DRAFT_377994 [Protomyces lactucae-debilis]
MVVVKATVSPVCIRHLDATDQQQSLDYSYAPDSNDIARYYHRMEHFQETRLILCLVKWTPLLAMCIFCQTADLDTSARSHLLCAIDRISSQDLHKLSRQPSALRECIIATLHP